MAFLLKLVIGLVVLVFVIAYARTWQVENSENQKIFAVGGAPNPALDGFYSGTVTLPIKITWTGKKFISASSTGINVFDDRSERYTFSTSVGTIGSSTVLNIAYNRPENPFWVRPIVDQLIQTGPGNYLGKMTLHVIPGYPISLGFFRLKK